VIITSTPALENRKGRVWYQVSKEFSRLDVPELDRAVVRGRDHELGVELQAGDGRLVLVQSCKQEKNFRSNVVFP
jgi:hypothetical protein